MTETKTKKQRMKRANGAGSVAPLPDGRFRYRVTVGYRNGKQVRHGGIADTRTKAEQAAAKAVADFARGLLGLSENTKLADYTSRWLERRKLNAPKTHEYYKRQLGYALEYLGHMPMNKIRPHHIRDTLHTLAERQMTSGLGRNRPMASATLARIRTRLKAVFTEAISDGVLNINPVDGVKRVKPLRTEHGGQALDFDQVPRLHELGETLYTAGAARLWPALFTTLAIGLRRGEVMGLRWQDVDFERNELTINQNLTTLNGEIEIRPTKTESGQRQIIMPASLAEILKRQRAAMVKEASIRGEDIRPTSPVFATILGTYTNPDNLSRALTNILEWSHSEPIERKAKGKRGQDKEGNTKKVGLPERLLGIPHEHRAKLKAVVLADKALPTISPHDLRHTAGTLMLRKGMPIEVVSKILGHARISITLDVYRHVLDSERRANVVDLFDAPLPVRETLFVQPH